ncbi:MAG: ABC transporter ATP-binding protein [Treponema sp.]|jgi:iron complex transport system ATP-binding protein|nr:ABC transporter ATP-binding protein [Treponema sp.]
MLELVDLYCGYEAGKDVLKGVSLRAGAGEILCLAGPNGCGKSTLLKAAARLLPFRGSVKIRGRESASYSRRELARCVALLGQYSTLYFPYTVYDTAAMGRYAHSGGILKGRSVRDREIVVEALRTLELYDVRDKLISELSGGQLQRVFLARTLAQDPDIILLDEPTNHLDLKHQIGLLDYLRGWVKRENKTVVAVIHDLNLCRRFGEKTALLSEGTLAAFGGTADILNGGIIKTVYGMDVREYMLRSLESWRG